MKFNKLNRSKVRNAETQRVARQRLRFEMLEDRRLLVNDFNLIDINQRPETVGSLPEEIVSIGSTAYLTADTPAHGRELWKSNGTSAGTVLVKDLLAGSAGSNPSRLTPVGSQLFFLTENDTGPMSNSRDLWRSDGTTSGTIKLLTGVSPFTGMVNFNGTLFFSASAPGSGTELWKSNGTVAGTVMVKEIAAGSSSSDPAGLINVNGTLFFNADDGLDGINGRELWKSNGTNAGTVLVKDITPGPADSRITVLGNVNGIVMFAIRDESGGVSLWKSSGTSGGTTLVRELSEVGANFRFEETEVVGSTLFFTFLSSAGFSELWKSDGTNAGTVVVKDILPGSVSSGPQSLTRVGNTLYFTADDGSSGRNVWKSNGTAAGTVLLKDIDTGVFGPGSLTNVSGTLYFVGSSGLDLWKSDGTNAGTVRLVNMIIGSNTDSPVLANVNGTLFFNGRGTNGTELWKSNGTAAGTVEIRDIREGTIGSRPGNLTNFAGSLYFNANDGVSGTELWKSNGTAGGTVLVKDINPGVFSSGASNLVVVGNVLYFTAFDSINGTELWKTNGSATGTFLVKDIRPGSSTSSPGNLFNHNGTLYFTANDGTNGPELWKSNGTAAGTVLVKDIRPGGTGSEPRQFTSVGADLYFTAHDGTNGREIWKSNGTDAGTVLVKDILPGSYGSYPSDLTVVGNTLFFAAETGEGVAGEQLWKSNGSAAGTIQVNQTIHSFNPSFLTNFNGTLFFSAEGVGSDRSLWKSNGTVAGTVEVTDPESTGAPNNPEDLVVVNNVLMFTIVEDVDTNDAAALWRSNGTAAGTVLIKQFDDFEDFSYIDSMVNANGTLYFSPRTASHGFELWKSNGTAAGTVFVQDFEPGTVSGEPGPVIAVGSQLFVTATTAQSGTELYAATGSTTATTLAIAATSANKNEGNAGSTSFTFTVTRSGSLTGATTVNYAVTGVGASPATASDFDGNAFPSGTVTFASGQATRVITIPVRGDTTVEADQGFRVTLSGASGGATITTATASGVIQNDDTAPVPTSLTIAATSANKNEGQSGTTSFTFTVTRTGSLTGATTVNYAVTGVGVSPAAATDFVGNVLPSGTVTFATGQATRVITIPVRGDTTVESNETFRVMLSSASGGATITTATANGLIRNDDTALAIAATSANKNEGNSGSTSFTFTVTRSGSLTGTTTVNYVVAGNGANPAIASDFIGNAFPSGIVSFAAGETTKLISIRVRGDVTVEQNEGFRVTLSNPSGSATITTAVVSGLIRNDDTSLAIAATSASKNEGNSGFSSFTFTVTRAGVLTGTTSVDYVVAGNGANPAQATDFFGNVLPSGTVTFAPGDTTKVISIRVRGDSTVEPSEGLRVTLSNPSLGSSLTTAVASGLIRNDDI